MEGRIKDEVPIPHKSRRTQIAWLAIAAALVLAAGSAVMLLIPRTPAPAPQTASSTPRRLARARRAAPPRSRR